jgi:hypothetical protein
MKSVQPAPTGRFSSTWILRSVDDRFGDACKDARLQIPGGKIPYRNLVAYVTVGRTG